MPVNVMQWRVEIGVFETLCDIRYTTKFSRSSHSSSKKITVINFILLLLFLSGDTESKTELIKLILIANFLSATGI